MNCRGVSQNDHKKPSRQRIPILKNQKMYFTKKKAFKNIVCYIKHSYKFSVELKLGPQPMHRAMNLKQTKKNLLSPEV